MSLKNYRVADLWRSFMPDRNLISNRTDDNLISLAIYKSDHFTVFNPENEFEKWAAAQVNTVDDIPAGLEATTLPGGLYAVFDYKGLNTDNSIYQYIYGIWLPASDYSLDNRPHFEVLGPKYKNNDPDSEEEIYIPIKRK